MKMMPTEIIWKNNWILIKNPIPEMLKALNYSRRSLEQTKSGNFKYEKFCLYQKISEAEEIYVTHHGFIDLCLQIAKDKKHEVTVIDRRMKFPKPRFDLALGGLRGVQTTTTIELLAQNRSGILEVPTRWGKCLGEGTPVLMYDGYVKHVEHIKAGELLMGPDGLARTPENLVFGWGAMYKIIPEDGLVWTCNKDHILHLYSEEERCTVNVNVEDYLLFTPAKRKKYNLLKVLNFHPEYISKLYKFDIEPIGFDYYYGFSIVEDDKLFVLQDGTITHNSYVMNAVIKAFPNISTVVAMPGVDLVRQFYENCKVVHPTRSVSAIASTLRYTESTDITIVSFDSLDKIDRKNCKLLLVDEVHSGVSDTRAPYFSDFENARIYGFSATTKGRFDGADKLIEGLFGPVLVRKTFQQSVADGMVCPIRVFMIKVEPRKNSIKNYAIGMQHAFYNYTPFYEIIGELCNEIIPKDWQTLVFIRTKKQAAKLSEYVHDSREAVAANMTTSERKELFQSMQNNEVSRCIATSVYAQGVTFSDLRVMINFSGGGGNIFTIQKPGRLAEVRKGKKFGYMVDFYFPLDYDWSKTDNRVKYCREAETRRNTYESMGYEVIDVGQQDVNTIKFI